MQSVVLLAVSGKPYDAVFHHDVSNLLIKPFLLKLDTAQDAITTNDDGFSERLFDLVESLLKRLDRIFRFADRNNNSFFNSVVTSKRKIGVPFFCMERT
ncbi:MAG: hypothetical protein ACSLEN_06965 [Candidatus Malihini olakiniferum]